MFIPLKMVLIGIDPYPNGSDILRLGRKNLVTENMASSLSRRASPVTPVTPQDTGLSVDGPS